MTSVADLIEQEIEQLNDLRERGIISDAEFDQQRQAILAAVPEMLKGLSHDAAVKPKKRSFLGSLFLVLLCVVLALCALAFFQGFFEGLTGP